MIKQKLDVTLNPTRKIRTKTKRPKFLSIRLELSPEKTHNSGKMTAAPDDHQQLNLFPLHPEDRDTHDDNNVEYFFSGSDGGATSLTGLLGDGSASSCGEKNNETAVSPSSVTYAYGAAQDSALERTALRNRERDASEEVKWVCYSEVVERKDEEVSSCDADLPYYNGQSRRRRLLSLKLDYEEIMNAWSDKGPLYIHVDSPQTVPQLRDDFLDHDDNPNGGRQLGLWAVPEMSGGSNSSGSSSIKLIKEEECLALNINGGVEGEELKKLGQREASVLRYKEKRHNRLFAKKIRYEVRKLNAEKRPRIKGRFVKRS